MPLFEHDYGTGSQVKDDTDITTTILYFSTTELKEFKNLCKTIRINGDGELGRAIRGSSQTERQIKSITTRVGNITTDLEFNNSQQCLNYLIKNY